MSRFQSLDQFKPDAPEDVPPLPVARIDQVAAAHGFVSREPVARKKRQTAGGPSDQINIRASVADINVFIDWCERNRYTNREGFSELVRLIPR